jgi:hypothetical protein
MRIIMERVVEKLERGRRNFRKPNIRQVSLKSPRGVVREEVWGWG